MANQSEKNKARSFNIRFGKRSVLFIAAILSLAVITTILVDDSGNSSAASVGSTFQVDGVTYEVLNDSDVQIVYVYDHISSITIYPTVTNPKDTWEPFHWNSKTYNITGVANNAFIYANDLSSISVSGNTYFSSSDGILFNSSGSTLICYPIAKIGNAYNVPSNVSSIGPYAFCDCDNLETVTIGSNVTYLGDHAFYSCDNIETMTIGSGLSVINAYTFFDCNDMGTFTLDSNITSIGKAAFYNCEDLYTAKIGSDVELQTGFVKISPSVTSLGAYSFSECDKIVNLHIGVPTGTSPITIGNNAFYDCDKLTNVVLGCSVKIIGDDSFHDCVSLSSVVIPTSVTKIGSHAFISTSLKAVAIPKTTNVSSSAFELTLLGGPWEIYYGGDHIAAAVLRCGSAYDTGADNHYTLTVVPETGYKISGFSYSGNPSDISRVGTTNVWNISSGSLSAGGHVVTFTTALMTYTITTSVQNGTISPSTIVNYGGSTSVTYSSTSQYHLVSVTVDGVLVTGHDSSYTFSDVTGNHTISVVYAINTYVVTLDKDAHTSSITYSVNDGPVQTYTIPFTVNQGDKVEITAVTDAGYHFVQWAPGVTSNPLVIASVTSNLNYTAYSAINTFTVTLSKDTNISSLTYRLNGGTIQTYTSPLTVNYGDNLVLTANLDSGYHFVQWASGITENPLSISDVESNIEYSATSAIDTFTVTLSMDSHVSGITYVLNGGPSEAYSLPLTVNYGDILTITANLDEGYHFVQWSAGVTDNPLTIDPVTSNIQYVATSSMDTFTVTLSMDSHISGIRYSLNGAPSQQYSVPLTVDYGDDLEIKAIVETGYYFVQWAPGVTDNPLTISDIESDIIYSARSNAESISVTLGMDSHISGIEYSLNGGPSQEYTTSFYVDYDTDIEITAYLDTGYYFTGWSGTVVSTDNPLSLNVVTDLDITGSSSVYSFNVILGGDSNVSYISYSLNGGQSQHYIAPFDVDYGSSIKITAVIDEGYHFKQWAGSFASTQNPLTITVTDDIDIKATSSIDLFNVVLNKDSHISSITYTLNGGSVHEYTTPFVVEYGDNLMIRASVDTGYYFVQWAPGITDNPLTITNVDSDILYNAKSSMEPFNVVLEAGDHISSINYVLNGGSSVVYVSSFTVNYGDDLQITAIMETGYHFITWSGTITSTDNPLALEVTSDVDIGSSAEGNQYSVTFLGNYPESTYSESITETYGDTYVLPSDEPTREGYNFAGWYTTQTGGSKITDTTYVTITGDTNLYAHWTAQSGGNSDIGKILPWLFLLLILLVIAAFLIRWYIISKRKKKSS
jgi:uncharacterized repeat protein (TIGR02543 family)